MKWILIVVNPSVFSLRSLTQEKTSSQELTTWCSYESNNCSCLSRGVFDATLCDKACQWLGGFLWVFGFIHQYNWPPWNSWIIIECGVKHYNPTPAHLSRDYQRSVMFKIYHYVDQNFKFFEIVMLSKSIRLHYSILYIVL